MGIEDACGPAGQPSRGVQTPLPRLGVREAHIQIVRCFQRTGRVCCGQVAVSSAEVEPCAPEPALDRRAARHMRSLHACREPGLQGRAAPGRDGDHLLQLKDCAGDRVDSWELGLPMPTGADRAAGGGRASAGAPRAQAYRTGSLHPAETRSGGEAFPGDVQERTNH